VRHDLIPGQLNLFNNVSGDEKSAEIIEPEVIKVSGYSKERKPKARYEEIFENLPAKQVFVDTLTEEEK
jgi:hypothetical protein